MRHNQGLSTCRESRRLLYSRSRLQDTYRMAYHARTPGGNPAWTSRLSFVPVAHPCEARIRSYDLRPILPGRRMCWRVGRGMGWWGVGRGVGWGVARDRTWLKGSLESSIAPRHMPAPFMSVTVYDVQRVCVRELRYRIRHLALVSSISPRLPVRAFAHSVVSSVQRGQRFVSRFVALSVSLSDLVGYGPGSPITRVVAGNTLLVPGQMSGLQRSLMLDIHTLEQQVFRTLDADNTPLLLLSGGAG